MKKFLLLFTMLLAMVAMPTVAQVKLVKKYVTMQLLKKRAHRNKVNMYGISTLSSPVTLGNVVIAGYYPAAASGEDGYENYYLKLSDKADVSYDAEKGNTTAANAIVASLDLYAPDGTGMDLPTGTFAAGEGNLHFDSDLSYVERFDANGNTDGGTDLDGDVTVTKNAETGSYTLSFKDESGVTYSYEGELSFSDMTSGGSNVYPQITTDINTTFTGGLAYYYGNLMESNTGNMVIDLYDGEYNPETGGMTSKGIDLTINLYNRLFGDPKEAILVPGTYTVARNFKVNTFFPGMEVDYMGMTIPMGTYVKRRKAMNNLDSDYDYAWIVSGTITITEGEKEGTFDLVIDCLTDRGYKVKGTAKGISFPVSDLSEKNTKDVDSNLTEDVNLNFDRVPKSRIYSLGVQNGVQVFTVDLGSPSGKDDQDGKGDQDLLRMEFQAAEGSAYLPEGTYRLMEDSHLYTNEYAPFMMTRGYFDSMGGRTGTKYEHFRANPDPEIHLPWVVDKFATIYSGTVGVSKTDNTHYKFVIDLFDGNGFEIKGEFDKEMIYCYTPEAITGINGVFVDAANKSEVYSLDGQLLKTVNASASESVSNLPSGIYLVKSNNKTIKIVKK